MCIRDSDVPVAFPIALVWGVSKPTRGNSYVRYNLWSARPSARGPRDRSLRPAGRRFNTPGCHLATIPPVGWIPSIGDRPDRSGSRTDFDIVGGVGRRTCRRVSPRRKHAELGEGLLPWLIVLVVAALV